MSRCAAFIWALICVLALSHPGEQAYAADAVASCESVESEEAEDDEIRKRLTEREDKRRPVKPWCTLVAGRPLTFSGEYGGGLDYLRRRAVGEPVRQPDRSLVEQGLDGEVFYTYGRPLALFAQLSVKMEKDLLSGIPGEISDRFVERGEMWLYSERIAGSGFNFDLGRLNFEDDRRWWWDDELDAVRVEYEAKTFEIALALAQELAQNRSDRDDVDPEHERVRRLLAEASWDFSPRHSLQLFLLRHNDRSSTERLEQIVAVEREDESDARLTWLGARLTGAFKLGSQGELGYWLDWARVRGDERLVEYEALSAEQSAAENVTRQDVSGRAFDTGINWFLPIAWEPRVFVGYAFGSGNPPPAIVAEPEPEPGEEPAAETAPMTRTDRSFRQTGLHANEAGFGGVQRFAHYGVALDPELSNLRILTFGAGRSLLKSSSLDLVYHRYRLVEPATSLRDARLETTPNGQHRDLGNGIDLVLALEEWEQLEFEFTAGGFRAGRAFGIERGRWSYAGFFAMRIAF